MKQKLSHFFPYFGFSAFILVWWALAFYQVNPTELFDSSIKPQTLILQNSDLLQEVSTLERDQIHEALAGNFNLMHQLILKWDAEAEFLLNRHVKGIKQLPKNQLDQVCFIYQLLTQLPRKKLKEINCRLRIDQLVDDRHKSICIQDHFQRYLPQTYTAASILLAIAQTHEIVAIPKGLRSMPFLYSLQQLSQIELNTDCYQSEQLYLSEPQLAFIGTYSHPPSLDVLRMQGIDLFVLDFVNTTDSIEKMILKVGHASNHILEAQLLTLFMEASLLTIDNRLHLLSHQKVVPQSKHILCLSYHQSYMQPTSKSLTGHLLNRLSKHNRLFHCQVPQSDTYWHLNFEHENLSLMHPDCLIISISNAAAQREIINHPLIQQLKAFENQQLFYINETIQESSTQYCVLAYFDLYEAIAAVCHK